MEQVRQMKRIGEGKRMYKVFARKLFGVKYERISRTIIIWLFVFYGLYLADYRVKVAPYILYLMVGSLTAGVMWQALSSKDNAENMKNMFMLPFDERQFVFSYVSVLGAYTLLTKTAGLMAVVLAVSSWNGMEILGSILCAANAILMTACIYARKRCTVLCSVLESEEDGNHCTFRKSMVNTGLCSLWGGVVAAAVLLLRDRWIFFPVMTGNLLFTVWLLSGTDAYLFCFSDSSHNRVVRGRSHASVWRYLFRYLTAHKNYLVNTGVMWLAACVMPVFLGQIGSLSVMPIGFAVLSLNTPICILLSCDPDLEQAVRFLPGQEKVFCIPYCLFIFLCNMAADVIFIISWLITAGQIKAGGISVDMNVVLTAVFFAMQSAVGSVLLEWFYPIRGWKIESDLWHHPRKYIVPGAMLLLAGVVGTIPVIMPVLMVLLVVEIIYVLHKTEF